MKHETTSIDDLATKVRTLQETDVSGMSEEERKAYQKSLASMGKAVSDAMAKTSQKEHNYDMEKLSEYVQHILTEAWECRVVPLSAWDDFKDAQKLKRFAKIIKYCVEHSKFDGTFLKEFPVLAVQRSDIMHAKNLQELRTAVRAMVGPLRMAREWKEYRDGFNYYIVNTIEIDEYETVLAELEETKAQLREVRRVNNEILALFEPSEELQGKALLEAIENFKKEHNCTDTEACKPFNVSRTTLHRLRKEFKC